MREEKLRKRKQHQTTTDDRRRKTTDAAACLPHVCRMSAARLPHVCRMFAACLSHVCRMSAACLSHVCRMFVITMSLGAPRPSNTVTITLMILAFMAQASFGVCVQELVRFLARDFKPAAMECPRCKQWCGSRYWSPVQTVAR